MTLEELKKKYSEFTLKELISQEEVEAKCKEAAE
jgi:hypothetical protein